MGINKKLIQFVDYLDISQRRFTKECGVAEGALRGGRSVSVESLIKIKQTYPILNLKWLLFGEGEMILPENQSLSVNEEGEENQLRQSIDKIIDFKIDIKFKELQKQLSVIIATQDLVIDKVFEDGWKEVQEARSNRPKNKKAN